MAKKTFARAKTPGGTDGQWHHRLGSQDLMTHLKQLSDLMHGLTARDLGLDQSKVHTFCAIVPGFNKCHETFHEYYRGLTTNASN